MPKKRKSFMSTRKQGGVARYYGDFREYGDVGGKREALIPDGARQATTDHRLARILVTERIADLEDRRRRKQRGEPQEEAFLAAYVQYHLWQKREGGNVSKQWLDAAEMHLKAAIEFFCNEGKPLAKDRMTGKDLLTGVRDRSLRTITTRDAQEFVAWLRTRSNGRESSLSPSSQRKYLNSLSNLFRRALGEEHVRNNPVAALMDKPQDGSESVESDWLEVHDAALLLESARLYRPTRPKIALPPRRIHAIVATLLLTGGRPSEVLGMQVRDVSFERNRVSFRPNRHRKQLKTANANRALRLWPQLEEILREYLNSEGGLTPDDLLFPSNRTRGVITDIRAALDEVAGRAGWKAGEIRPYAFRHTYCAARLQTVDMGYPVTQFTIANELGHSSTRLIQRVYGHLGDVRHRSDVVEFRVEQHERALGDRLIALRAAQDG